MRHVKERWDGEYLDCAETSLENLGDNARRFQNVQPTVSLILLRQKNAVKNG